MLRKCATDRMLVYSVSLKLLAKLWVWDLKYSENTEIQTFFWTSYLIVRTWKGTCKYLQTCFEVMALNSILIRLLAGFDWLDRPRLLFQRCIVCLYGQDDMVLYSLRQFGLESSARKIKFAIENQRLNKHVFLKMTTTEIPVFPVMMFLWCIVSWDGWWWRGRGESHWYTLWEQNSLFVFTPGAEHRAKAACLTTGIIILSFLKYFSSPWQLFLSGKLHMFFEKSAFHAVTTVLIVPCCC